MDFTLRRQIKNTGFPKSDYIASFLCSLGGSLPILIAYYSEFIPRPQRVRYLCALLACWAFGGIYVALMAWAILPKTGQ